MFKEFSEVIKMEVEKDVRLNKLKYRLVSLLSKLRREIVLLNNYFEEYGLDGHSERVDALQRRLLDMIGDIYMVETPDDFRKIYYSIVGVVDDVESLVEDLRSTSKEKYDQYRQEISRLKEVYEQLQKLKRQYDEYKRVYSNAVRRIGEVENMIRRVRAMLR